MCLKARAYNRSDGYNSIYQNPTEYTVIETSFRSDGLQ